MLLMRTGIPEVIDIGVEMGQEEGLKRECAELHGD
jgi:hypothetical protein